MVPRNPKIPEVTRLAFLGLLAVGVWVLSSLPKTEAPWACDAFGYLYSSKVVRDSIAKRELPNWTLRSPQTSVLVSRFEKKGIHPREWDDAIGPYAFSYKPTTNKVVLQYPPGTGMALALFPEGVSVLRISQITLVLLMFGAALLLLRGSKPLVQTIPVAIVILVAMMALHRIGYASYSINVLIGPLVLCCWLTVLARRQLLALLAGALFGFCVLTRVPSLLLLPGFLVMFWDKKRLALGFLGGMAVTGLIPLGLYQAAYAGSWWSSTYSSADTSALAPGAMLFNLNYYLVGLGSKLNWGLLLMGIALWPLRKSVDSRTWLASLAAFSVSFVFFLTRSISTPYYLVPSTLAAVALVGFSAYFSPLGAGASPSRWPTRFALGVLLAWIPLVGRYAPPTEVPHPPTEVPEALLSENAWVWAGENSGPLQYHFQKMAFRPQNATPPARDVMLNLPFDRGERLFVIADFLVEEVLAEIRANPSWKIIPAGKAWATPVYEVARARR